MKTFKYEKCFFIPMLSTLIPLFFGRELLAIHGMLFVIGCILMSILRIKIEEL